jgi:hypothetical protein
MSTLYVIRQDNGFILRLSDLTSELTGLEITTATVTGTVVEKSDGTELTGISWPVDMASVNNTNTYESAVLDAGAFTDETCRRLRAYAVVDAGGVPGKFWAELALSE